MCKAHPLPAGRHTSDTSANVKGCRSFRVMCIGTLRFSCMRLVRWRHVNSLNSSMEYVRRRYTNRLKSRRRRTIRASAKKVWQQQLRRGQKQKRWLARWITDAVANKRTNSGEAMRPDTNATGVAIVRTNGSLNVVKILWPYAVLHGARAA
jgi:hypothetical protein